MTKKELSAIVPKGYLEAFRKDEKFRAIITSLAFSMHRNEWCSPENLAHEFYCQQPELGITAADVRCYAQAYPVWIDYKRGVATHTNPMPAITAVAAYARLRNNLLSIGLQVLAGK